LKFSSHLRKGTASENRFLFCMPDMAYGSCLIRRISEKSALAVEIDLTWSRGFIYVELDRLPNLLFCKTLLICPICISKVLIEAPWFLMAASVEDRISLIMFEFSSCLLADSAMNLVSDSSSLVSDQDTKNFHYFVGRIVALLWIIFCRLLLKFSILPFVDNLSYSVVLA
ncbi:hypothetical protein Tco_0220065, partial [Tanacetum coccineum]